MQTYVKHLQSKQRQKLALTSQTMTVDVEVPPASVAELSSSPSPPSVTSETPVAVAGIDPPPIASVQGVTFDQVKELLSSFSQSLEVHFASIDKRISQGLASNAVDRNVSQDVLTLPYFSAPSALAGHSEPAPDRVPSVPYTGGLGSNLGGSAAAVGLSLPRSSFDDLIARVRDLEALHGYVPDFFLSSLRGVVVHASDHLFALSGDSLCDSIVHTVRHCVIRCRLPLGRLGIATVLYLSYVLGCILPYRPLPLSLELPRCFRHWVLVL